MNVLDFGNHVLLDGHRDIAYQNSYSNMINHMTKAFRNGHPEFHWNVNSSISIKFPKKK